MKTALDYMTKNIIKLDSSKSVFEAVEIMREKKIGSIFVEENDKVIGIFTERDLLNKIDLDDHLELKNKSIKVYMTKDMYTVSCSEHYINIIEKMRENNIRHMPVVEKGKIVGIVSFRDILHRYNEELENMLKEREKELYENMKILEISEKRFHSIFDNSAVAITFVDEKEKIVAWNPFAANLFGMNDDDLRNKPVNELYPEKEWKCIRSQNIRQLGTKQHLETKILTKEGKLIDVDISISVLKDSEGTITGSIGIMRDVSERKRLEQLREEFIVAVSHELRTPLAATKEGVSQVIEGLLGDINETQKNSLTVVLSEMNRLHRVLDNLLDISKLESGWFVIKREYIDMAKISEGVITAFLPRANEKGLKLKTRYSKKNIKGYADEDKITQVITNLINNAFKFTENGYIEVFIEEKESEVECSIIDTGIGIAKENLSTVFNKFTQFGERNPFGEKGTGLGLSICKGIIELHKGKIWVESELGEGSEFKFSLPKFTVNELFREYLRDSLQDAVRKGKSLSVVTYDIDDYNQILANLGKEKMIQLGQSIEALVKSHLHRDDIVINDICRILTVLPSADKKSAVAVSARIKKLIREYLSLEGWEDNIEIICKVSSFPKDGKTIDEVLSGVNKVV